MDGAIVVRFAPFELWKSFHSFFCDKPSLSLFFVSVLLGCNRMLSLDTGLCWVAIVTDYLGGSLPLTGEIT